MSRFLNLWRGLALALWCLLAGGGHAQDFSALARVDVAGSYLRDRADGGLDLNMALSQPVVYRVLTQANPNRIIIDFRTVDWPIGADQLDQAVEAEMSFLPRAAGWSSMSILLATPMRVDAVALETRDGIGATLRMRLAPTDQATFDAALTTIAPPSVAQSSPTTPRRGAGETLRVALDPGHGGIDSGAEVAGIREADLALTFARELRDMLQLMPGVEVVMTRDADIFVPLPDRMVLARRAGAHVFVSLHADSLAEGYAEGVSVYALSGEDGAAASAILTEREDRSDILSGVDLTGTDDEVAGVLLELARRETLPRSLHLSHALLEGLSDAGVRLNSNPTRSAHFAVLRSADIPSVLVEVGFLSAEKDRDMLSTEEGRLPLVEGLALGLQAWAISDAVDASLLRQ